MVHLRPTDENDISPLRGGIAPFSTATIAHYSLKEKIGRTASLAVF